MRLFFISFVDASQRDLFKLYDNLVLMKKTVAETLYNWNALLSKLDSRKRDDKQKSKSMSNEVSEKVPI